MRRNCFVISRLTTTKSGMSWSDKLVSLLQNFDIQRIRYHGEKCKPFFIASQQVGMIRSDIWEHLSSYTEIFKYDKKLDRVHLNPLWGSPDERSSHIEKLLQELRMKGMFVTLQGWRNECYDVSSKFGDPSLMKMERSATCLFGIKRYGVHINGYTKSEDGSYCVWIQRRAATKETWPRKLDNMVSGGFTVGLTVTECVRKEAQEEASLPPNLLDAIRPAGAVSFVFEDERGIFPETLFLFDLELPSTFQPLNSDSEVESFHLVSIDELKKILVTEDFKLTSTPATVDFLIRHGFLSPDNEPNYCLIMDILHAPLHNLFSSTVINSGDGRIIDHNSL